MSRVESAGAELSPTGRVPAEHRLFGLDRRTLKPALIVIGLFVFWTVLIPALNSALSYKETTKAGDVFVLAPGLTMDAEEGWGIEAGLLTSSNPRGGNRGGEVSLTNGGVDLQVTPGPFKGDLHTLLSQIDKVTSVTNSDEALNFSDDTQTFHTNDGHEGIAQAYTTVDGEGAVVALVYGGTGLKITLTGPEAELNDKVDSVQKMIESISFKKPAGS